MEKNKKKLKRGQIYWEIIKLIGLAYLSGGGSIMRPVLPMLIEEIIRLLSQAWKNDEISEKKVVESLKKIEKRELIDLVWDKEKILVYIREKNKAKILKYSLKEVFESLKAKKWVGKWYILFFDVPEIQRNKRDYLRSFLLRLGFYPYQKSVYIFPYECEKEINLIKKIVEGAAYAKYVVAEKIENEAEVKKFYHLY